MNEKNIFYPRFRTFSKHYNKYFKVGAIDFVKRSIKLELFGVNNSEWLPLEDFKLEQFTGLQDKEGTDIYVGDIVLLNNTKMLVVNYHNEKASFMLENDSGDYSLTIDKTTRLEIIGNINKNKEYYKWIIMQTLDIKNSKCLS